jgi:hypothetical protein
MFNLAIEEDKPIVHLVIGPRTSVVQIMQQVLRGGGLTMIVNMDTWKVGVLPMEER